MIKMIGTESGVAPIVVCDICLLRIEHYRDGAVASILPATGESADVMHVHRGTCYAAAEQLLGSRSGDAPLSNHFIQLVHSVGLPPMTGAPKTIDEIIAHIMVNG